MADNSKPVPRAQVRELLRAYAERLGGVLSSKGYRDNLRRQIKINTIELQWLDREARRKTRSPLFLQAHQQWLEGAAQDKLGPLDRLKPNQIEALHQLLDGILEFMTGKPNVKNISPKDVHSLFKALLVPPRSPGRQRFSKYDTAFTRRIDKESLTSIVKDLEPDNYAADAFLTLQRYSKAIQRRKKQASRL